LDPDTPHAPKQGSAAVESGVLALQSGVRCLSYRALLLLVGVVSVHQPYIQTQKSHYRLGAAAAVICARDGGIRVMISLPVRVRARADDALDRNLAPFPLCYWQVSRCHEIRNSGAPVKVSLKRSRHHPMFVQRVRKESLSPPAC
jgi:hypothetical protein